jgi:phage gp29-like protein
MSEWDRFKLSRGLWLADPEPEERRRAPRATTRRVINEQALSLQLRRIGGNLTPQKVTEILRNADAGNIYGLVDLANESRQKDTDLHALLAVREDMLAGLPWEVTEPPDATPDEKLATEFVRTVLSALDDNSGDDSESLGFTGLIEHLQVANYHGFSAAELQWRRDGRYLVPVHIWAIAHRRFAFRDIDGRLIQKDEHSFGKQQEFDLLRDFPLGNFIQHQPRVLGDIKAREGLSRLLVWSALFRNWTLKDWLLLAEIGWKPWRRGTYKKNAPENEIDELIAMLEEMSSSAVAAHSEDITVAVDWPKSGQGKSNHQELHAYLGRGMAKAIVGATDIIESDATGARAATQERGKRVQEKLEKDARSAVRTIRAQLIRPLVRYNPFPAGIRIPGFAFATRNAVDLKSFSESVKNLTTAKVPLSKSWIYDEMGGGKPENDEDATSVESADDGDESEPPTDPGSAEPEGSG